jgi:hypothetical protein
VELPWRGGYVLEFKLVEAARRRAMGRNLERLRRESVVVGPAQQRVIQVEFSKGEYCRGKVRAELDDYTIFVLRR